MSYHKNCYYGSLPIGGCVTHRCKVRGQQAELVQVVHVQLRAVEDHVQRLQHVRRVRGIVVGVRRVPCDVGGGTRVQGRYSSRSEDGGTLALTTATQLQAVSYRMLASGGPIRQVAEAPIHLGQESRADASIRQQ